MVFLVWNLLKNWRSITKQPVYYRLKLVYLWKIRIQRNYWIWIFYKTDAAYTGAPSHNGKRGLGTDKQPFLIVLETEQENQYPHFVKMQEVATDSSKIVQEYFEKYAIMSKERKLNTDGKTTYNILKNRMEVNNEVIDYDNDNHRLYFLNKIISNLNSQLIDRFHRAVKRMLPLYYSEFEWTNMPWLEAWKMSRIVKWILTNIFRDI